MFKKKAVLFDLDDTLYDYDPAHKAALKQVYKILKEEIKISYNKFLRLYNISKSEIHRELAGTASSHNRVLYFQRLIEKTHQTIASDTILKLYNAYWDAFLKKMKLRIGVLKTFKTLKDNCIKIGIVTDLTANIQLRKLSKLGLNHYINTLVTSEETGSEKPNPIMFLLALNKLNILPKDAVFVGDNPIKDIEGGNSIGLDTILISNKKTKQVFDYDYQKPDHYIQEIPEILDIIKK
ncbi:MAG: HAD-IA family hydrolase [Nanoarchaeota archaeon]|nr:HAD-IA family hydrolase [Nanoarchaeota archaeon]